MKLKDIMIIASIILFVSCNTKQSDKKESIKHFVVQLMKFQPMLSSELERKLDGKTYQFVDDKIILQKDGKSGHFFKITRNDTNSNYIIKINEILESEDSLKVSIKFFEINGENFTQYSNPGEFYITGSNLADKVESLRELIVKLTFK